VAHSARVKLLGVSTTCGNQSVEKTTDNALRVLHLIGRDDVGVCYAVPSLQLVVVSHALVLLAPLGQY